MISLIALTMALSNQVFASNLGVIEEEVYIANPSDSFVELIGKNPELTIDHRDKLGMELFGPKGMKEWLDFIGVTYEVSNHNHGVSKSLKDAADYPTHKQIEDYLRTAVAKNPKIAKMFSIGKSVEGRELWVVKISDNVERDEKEPEFKYISSMHGDEITGRELTQYLVKDLIEAYGKDERITSLVNNTEIYIMPSMNPDGSKRRRRANANSVDLNRNFPDITRGDVNTPKGRQPETKAIMKFQRERNFSLSANFHGGAVVVNYPWDSTFDLHPLDNLLKDISTVYADENPAMRSSRSFPGGITNGAQWYVLHGGMQDWSYHWHNDLQVTVELSNKKWPRYSDIPGFYKDNKESMLKYLELIHQGAGIKVARKNVSGKVQISQNMANGQSKNIGTYGFERSEFFKVLEKGSYTFVVSENGSPNKTTLELEVDGSIQKNGNYLLLN